MTLLGSKPPIWRRVQVPVDIRLSTLHNVIQNVMGWDGDPLHQFIIGGECYGGAMLVDEYDFSDGWEHRLEVEKILPAEPGIHYPRCVAGKRARPPEDCGGVWGYAGLLEAIADPADPADPENQDMLEWVGEEFDPEAFDLDGVNERLLKRR